MQILSMSRNGGNLKIWRDIARFFCRVVTEKFPQNTSIAIVKNREKSSATMNVTGKSDEFIHLSIPTVSIAT
jgi:hypothetical protein